MTHQTISRDDAYYALGHTGALTYSGHFSEYVANARDIIRNNNEPDEMLGALVTLTAKAHEHIPLTRQMMYDGPHMVWSKLGSDAVRIEENAKDVLVPHKHQQEYADIGPVGRFFDSVFIGITNLEHKALLENVANQCTIDRGRMMLNLVLMA